MVLDYFRRLAKVIFTENLRLNSIRLKIRTSTRLTNTSFLPTSLKRGLVKGLLLPVAQVYNKFLQNNKHKHDKKCCNFYSTFAWAALRPSRRPANKLLGSVILGREPYCFIDIILQME